MLNGMDEMELLASVNPEPDVTGNPWADEVLGVAHDPLRGRRRRVIWIGGISVVAAAALVAGVLLLGGDPVDRVEIDPAGTTTPMRPAELPEIPWNDPIELRFERGTTLDEIVVPHPGPLLFKLPAELQGGEVSFCAGLEGPADPEAPLLPDTYRCSGDTKAAAGYLEAEGLVIASVFDEEIRVLYRDSESSPYSVIGSLAIERSPAADQAPSLESQFGDLSSLEPQLGDLSYPWLTRNNQVVALTGAGFDPGEQVTIAVCLGAGYAPIDYRDCESATATLANETGDIKVDVDVADAATLENGVVEIFAFQGDRLDHTIGFMRSGAYLVSLPSDDTDTNVEVRVVGLLPGEVGRIEVCPWAGFACSVDPVRSYTVVGTGSDDLTVNVAARGFGSMGLWLYVNDVPAPVGGIPVPRIPGSAEQLPPGTLDVSPSSVPGPDHYTFTVTGSGWTAEGPIFVWTCSTGIVEQTAHGSPLECGTGDTETSPTRARVTPVDGAFTVERPYAPGQDFFIIASDGAQTQVATFRVKFGEP
jgi:hypothetical protein